MLQTCLGALLVTGATIMLAFQVILVFIDVAIRRRGLFIIINLLLMFIGLNLICSATGQKNQYFNLGLMRALSKTTSLKTKTHHTLEVQPLLTSSKERKYQWILRKNAGISNSSPNSSCFFSPSIGDSSSSSVSFISSSLTTGSLTTP